MELLNVYHEIEKRLETLDFPALLRGFHRFPFALYNDAHAVIDGERIEKPAEFIANTSVLFRGEQTAIWNLTNNGYDLDTLTAKIVHEMLHAYQNAAGETRWADERAAFVNYRYEQENFAARIAEADLLRRCFYEDAPEDFSRLLSLRRARADRFACAYDYEARIEQIEGTAHLVELSALAQLDSEKAKARWTQLFRDLADPAQYFPVRAVTYLSGAALLACLKKYTALDTEAFTDTPFALEAIQNAEPCPLPEGDARVQACLAAWQDQTAARIAETLEKGELVLEGEYRLIAWNVYDSVWDGKYAVVTGFLGYIEGMTLPETDEALFAMLKIINGDFVAELGADMRISRVWKQ